MSHLSENSNKLKLRKSKNLTIGSKSIKNVWFIHLPFYESLEQISKKDELYNSLKKVIVDIPLDSTIAILTSSIVAADFLSDFEDDNSKINLWVSIKLKNSIPRNNNIDQHHAILAIITKYNAPLKHTKTRISYTYCPSCNRTTKDYGGKKHLYHEFGTLMSDVWRDIEYDYLSDANNVIDRLRDLFGIEDYSHLNVIDLRDSFKINNNFIKKTEELSLEKNNFSYNGVNNSILINGDSLDILKNIPTGSIDYCFADPPYNLKKKYETWDDDLDIEEYFNWCDSWISEMSRVLKPGGVLSILNIPLWSIRHFKHLKEINELKFHDWITWEGLSLPVRMIMPSNYVIINFSKGNTDELDISLNDKLKASSKTIKEFYCNRISCVKKRKKDGIDDKQTITNLWWDIHRLKHNSRRVDHPCQLPPLLMQRLIETYTKEGEVVLDPFNGAGTTTLVADLLNRKYVGIELDAYYHNIALERHEEITDGIDPFRKNDDIPRSKNSNVNRMNGNYEIPKKDLQLYIKELASNIGHLPNREEVINDNRYPIEYFDEYFVNWAEVCAAARTTGMQEYKVEVS